MATLRNNEDIGGFKPLHRSFAESITRLTANDYEL
jgi:hypothetical protein